MGVNACFSYRVMCLSWLVFFPETVCIWITLFFKPKMDLISTIIVFGFLETQSNNVPVDVNQINKTYTCSCLGYEFCFQQHDNVTRKSYFFNPSSTYLRLNKKPITPDVTVFIYVSISSFYFSLETVFMFISEVLYSILYPHH